MRVLNTSHMPCVGIEMTFAQNYLSRYLFTRELLPILQNCKGGHGRVVSVLGAGNGSSFDMTDPQLKNGFFWFGRAADQYAAMSDAITLEWNRRYNDPVSPVSPSFFHLFPGIVNTSSAKNQGFPWFIHWPSQFVLPLVATPPEIVAENVVFALTSDQISPKDCLLSPSLKPIQPIPFIQKGGLELRERLWKYTNDLLDGLIQ